LTKAKIPKTSTAIPNPKERILEKAPRSMLEVIKPRTIFTAQQMIAINPKE
jgi:hypothetical protein